MFYLPGRLLVSLRLLLVSVAVFTVLFVGTSPAFAAVVSGATTTITAVILPVRYVLLDNQGDITEIISNTTADVTPRVYETSFQSSELPLTPKLNQQYIKLLQGIQTTHFGTIYSRPPNQAFRAAYLGRLTSLISYDRTPFKTIRL